MVSHNIKYLFFKPVTFMIYVLYIYRAVGAVEKPGSYANRSTVVAPLHKRGGG
jgi:hypothetical protein